MKLFVLLALAVLGLTGCAARPGPALLAPVPAAADANHVTIHVATTREPDPEHSQSFCSRRSDSLHFARYTVSIPPNHKPANIEWPASVPADPATSFAIVDAAPLSQAAFADLLAAPGPNQAGPEEPSPVYIFVHGYNTNFPEALYRMAQLRADNPLPAKAVLFSWPSDGTLSGYVADKDAVTHSRDQLVLLLTLLTRDPRLGEVHLAAHSMGCWLTMEALRQLRLAGQDEVIKRLGTVILAAPDIDLDVFRRQAEIVGPLEPPLTVLASPDDRALFFSNRLGGERDRVGSLDARDPRIQAMAQALKFQLIDISRMSATDSLNHDRFVGAAASLQKLLAPKTSTNPLRKAGAFVLDAAASVLEVPGRLGRAAAESTQ